MATLVATLMNAKPDRVVQVLGHDVKLCLRHTTAEEAEDIRLAAIAEGLMKSEDYAPATEFWTCGWKVAIGENQYGDYVRLTHASDQVLEQAHSVLLEQAEEVIQAILKKAHQPKIEGETSNERT